MVTPKCDDGRPAFNIQKHGVGRNQNGVWRFFHDGRQYSLDWSIEGDFLHLGGGKWRLLYRPNGGVFATGGDPHWKRRPGGRWYIVEEGKKQNTWFLYLVDGRIGTRGQFGGMLWVCSSKKPKARRRWQKGKTIGRMLHLHDVDPLALADVTVWPAKPDRMKREVYARLSRRLRRYWEGQKADDVLIPELPDGEGQSHGRGGGRKIKYRRKRMHPLGTYHSDRQPRNEMGQFMPFDGGGRRERIGKGNKSQPPKRRATMQLDKVQKGLKKAGVGMGGLNIGSRSHRPHIKFQIQNSATMSQREKKMYLDLLKALDAEETTAPPKPKYVPKRGMKAGIDYQLDSWDNPIDPKDLEE